MPMERAIVSVTNDLVTDNRVHRSCMALMEAGFVVVLVGRLLDDRTPLDRPYKCHRMRLIFRRGPFFYVEFQIRLFLFLLFRRCSLLFANDLDTLAANYLIHRLKRIPVVYDSHEYFTEVPELQGRAAKKVWEWLEARMVPKLRYMVTVNQSIAKAYSDKYGVHPVVVRNIPMRSVLEPLMGRAELGLPTDRMLLILQGAGINVGRGGEEAIMAMTHLPGFHLVIIGGGDAWERLEALVRSMQIGDRVTLVPRVPYQRLMQYTRNADLGLSLDKDLSLNYRYSLPNKLFDYLHAGIPVLVTDLPEVAGLVRSMDAGIVIEHTDPAFIAQRIKALFKDPARLAQLRGNAKFAASTLDQEQEKQALLALLRAIGS